MNEEFNIQTMASLAIVQHEVFSSYVKAGFTEEQAMQLLLSMIQQGKTENQPE